MAKKIKWTSFMDKYLKQNYELLSARQIAAKLNISKHAVHRRVNKLKLPCKRHLETALCRAYSSDEAEFIKANACKLNVSQIAVALGRTEDSVRSKSKRMKISLATQVRPLSNEEQIRWHARVLGLKKT